TRALSRSQTLRPPLYVQTTAARQLHRTGNIPRSALHAYISSSALRDLPSTALPSPLHWYTGSAGRNGSYREGRRHTWEGGMRTRRTAELGALIINHLPHPGPCASRSCPFTIGPSASLPMPFSIRSFS